MMSDPSNNNTNALKVLRHDDTDDNNSPVLVLKPVVAVVHVWLFPPYEQQEVKELKDYCNELCGAVEKLLAEKQNLERELDQYRRGQQTLSGGQ